MHYFRILSCRATLIALLSITPFPLQCMEQKPDDIISLPIYGSGSWNSHHLDIFLPNESDKQFFVCAICYRYKGYSKKIKRPVMEVVLTSQDGYTLSMASSFITHSIASQANDINYSFDYKKLYEENRYQETIFQHHADPSRFFMRGPFSSYELPTVRSFRIVVPPAWEYNQRDKLSYYARVLQAVLSLENQTANNYMFERWSPKVMNYYSPHEDARYYKARQLLEKMPQRIEADRRNFRKKMLLSVTGLLCGFSMIGIGMYLESGTPA